jgi:hypothetical protein
VTTRNIAVSVDSLHTSDLAARDDDPRWTEIHRVLSWNRLSKSRVNCHVACGDDFESLDVPVTLSSGEITGALCPRCFGYLPWAAV